MLNPEVSVIAEIPPPSDYPPLALEVAKILDAQDWNSEFEIDDIFGAMQRGRTLAAFDRKGNIVGAGVMKSPAPGNKVASVSNLFVLRSYRCQGIGAKLMELAETIAIEEGATTIELTSTLEAEGFYSRLGYTMNEFDDHIKHLSR